MVNIKDIISPIENSFIEFNENLKESTKSSVDLVNIVINYAIKNKGKQLRPILCLLKI